MTKIKICGMRRPEDIQYVNACKPDYVGFICFPKSKRYVTPEEIGNLGSRLDPSIQKVGVFVNETVEAIRALVMDGAIDLVQLHGDENAAYIEKLRRLIGDHPIIKAVRVATAEDMAHVNEIPADYLLFDAFSKEYGGSGHTFDWSLIGEIKKPFFLAGGIGPSNVAEAVEALHPMAVDLSSAVEGPDGYKDRDKVTEMVELVHSL